MAPPKLARDAPRLDVLEPVEVGLLPIFRHEIGAAVTDRLQCRTGERFRVDIPLVGQPRLDDDAGAVAVRHGVAVRLDFVEQAQDAPSCSTIRAARDEAVHGRQWPNRVKPTASASVCAALATSAPCSKKLETSAPRSASPKTSAAQVEVRIVAQQHPAFGVEHVDARQVVPLADFEIVEVMRWRDLDCACALLRIGIGRRRRSRSVGRPTARRTRLAMQMADSEDRLRDAPRPRYRPTSSPAGWWRR